MKSFKKIITALFVGFISFAPPGTLIGIFLILAAFVGNVWIAAGAIFFVLAAAIFFVIKSRKPVSKID